MASAVSKKILEGTIRQALCGERFSLYGGIVEHHTLVIDDDTCRRIECDPYEVEWESADDSSGG